MPSFPRLTAIALAAAALSACATTYSGPVEVTRFAAETADPVVPGRITLEFPEEMSNDRARAAFAEAVANELRQVGYDVVMQQGAGTQVATIRTSRSPIDGIGSDRGPVSVGVGGSTGSYGSGVGLGVGINLGGSDNAPRVVSELSVRIFGEDGRTLWEGRAQQAASIKSPYADVEESARALAAALFRDFPSGNGETVTIDPEDL